MVSDSLLNGTSSETEYKDQYPSRAKNCHFCNGKINDTFIFNVHPDYKFHQGCLKCRFVVYLYMNSDIQNTA